MDASVWNVPEKNFWVTAMMGTIRKNMQLPAPPEAAPVMFRCAKAGMMVNLFDQAGASRSLETAVDEKLWIGAAERYWDFQTEVGAPAVAALSQADEPTRHKIKKEVIELLHQHYTPRQRIPGFQRLGHLCRKITNFP
jgi:hypothetical protein